MDRLSQTAMNPWLVCANVQLKLGDPGGSSALDAVNEARVRPQPSAGERQRSVGYSGASVKKVPLTMAPSWSAYLLPVCLGVTSVKQTDWEHICTPHSSTEANPDAEEQAGLFSAPCLGAKFPALLETRGRALLWQG